MLKALKISLVFIVLVFCIPLLLQAENCSWIKPSPECGLFLVTEVGAGHVFAPDQTQCFLSDLGFMVNLSRRYALGVAHYTALDSKYTNFRGGLKLRMRRWLNRSASLNLGAGALLWSGTYGDRHPSFTGDIGFSYKDLLILQVGCDHLRNSKGHSTKGVNWYAALKTGSYIGGGATVVGLALGILEAIHRATAG